MANYTIRQGCHRALPFVFGLCINKRIMARRVKFDLSCAYNLGNENQADINKLFGVGYLWNHHKDSARFGWNYNTETKKINIFAYCYVDRQRVYDKICEIELGKYYDLSLYLDKQDYTFYVKGDGDRLNIGEKVIHSPFCEKVFGFLLGVYFGGNETAPHPMNLELIKI